MPKPDVGLGPSITGRATWPVAVYEGPGRGKLFVPRYFIATTAELPLALTLARMLEEAGAPVKLVRPLPDKTPFEEARDIEYTGVLHSIHDYNNHGVLYYWGTPNPEETDA
jgi:hypothetical protein